MKILIDTNVLIDFLTKRNPLFYQSAGNIINSCFSGSIQGYIAAHTVMNSFYVLRKNYNLNQLKNIFSSLSRRIKIVSVDNNKILPILKIVCKLNAPCPVVRITLLQEI